MEVSILIVSYNSSAYLERCLSSLTSQSYKSFRVIVIDNASTDRSTDILHVFSQKLDIEILALKNNIGFAAANNLGASIARGDWLATLNPDAFPEPDWLANLVAASQRNPGCFFTSRLIQAENPNLLDGEGDAYHISGLAWRRHYGMSVSTPTQVSDSQKREVFSACAAAALYPLSDFRAVGGFDEDYFAYHEDVDLGFRLRLRGLRCIFVPAATVYHQGSASTGKESDFAIYHGHRNLVWTFVKNMPLAALLLFLPIHIMMNIFFLVSFLSKGRGRVIWNAKRDALSGLPKVLRRRNETQKHLHITTLKLIQSMEAGFTSILAARMHRTQN